MPLKLASFFLLAVALVALAPPAQAAEKRLALVIGESAYGGKPLATAANDAGLIAQTLQAAAFDVTGARDLDEESLRRAFKDFLEKTAAAGPDAVVFIYFAGYGLQLEGENYLIPTDATIGRDSDIPQRSTRMSDHLASLAAMPLKAGIVVLDAARANPFTLTGAPIAGGLALYEPGASLLLAFNAAPGTVAPVENGAYGAYAQALAEMIRDGARPLPEVFEKVRLRVSDSTKGAQVPWNSTKINSSFQFFERSAEAPAPARDPRDAALATASIKQLGPQQGYTAAIERDSVQGYEDYVAAYPGDPQAKRVRALLAARREALVWRRTRTENSPNAYWSYLRRYAHGPHAADARRRLARLDRELEPPESFEPIVYDLPPPPPEEIVYVDRPVLIFDDPEFDFAPPPPPPVYFLPPPPRVWVDLPPPVIVEEPYGLPVPVYVPVPVWERPPSYVEAPPANLIYSNLHNSVIADPRADHVEIKNPAGHVLSSGALTALGAGAAGLAVGAAIPHFMKKATPVSGEQPGAPPPVNPLAGHQHQSIPGAPLPAPGVNGAPFGGKPLVPPASTVAAPPAAKLAPGAALPVPGVTAPHPVGGPVATPTTGLPQGAKPLPGVTAPHPVGGPVATPTTGLPQGAKPLPGAALPVPGANASHPAGGPVATPATGASPIAGTKPTEHALPVQPPTAGALPKPVLGGVKPAAPASAHPAAVAAPTKITPVAPASTNIGKPVGPGPRAHAAPRAPVADTLGTSSASPAARGVGHIPPPPSSALTPFVNRAPPAVHVPSVAPRAVPQPSVSRAPPPAAMIPRAPPPQVHMAPPQVHMPPAAAIPRAAPPAQPRSAPAASGAAKCQIVNGAPVCR